MLHPIVINPEFLIDAKDNDEILNKFSSFIKFYKEYWKDIFILVDDKNNTLSKKYEEIKNEFGHESFIFNSILDFITSFDKTKKINLNIDISQKNIDDLIQNLKENKVKKIVTFPEYLKDEKISLKDITEKKPFSKMTTDQVIDRITSITRFSKNVTLIDPMIPYNIRIKRSFENAKKQNLETFKFYPDLKKDRYEEYNAIEIDGEIYSLLKVENEKKLKIRRKVMTDEQIKLEIECWRNLSEKIKEDIINCTSGIIGSLNPNVVINSHYKDKNKDDEPIQDIYDRHILALDLDYSYEVRKGLDIFDAKKKKLKNITSWYIKLDTGLFEKSAAYYVLTHSLFKPTEIIYN